MAELEADPSRDYYKQIGYDNFRAYWLDIIFTPRSTSAVPESAGPAGNGPIQPMRVALEMNPRVVNLLVVWVGEAPEGETRLLADLGSSQGRRGMVAMDWSQHKACELLGPDDCSSFTRDTPSLTDRDLDTLHGLEELCRSLVLSVELKLKQNRLQWKNVVLCGYGKGAGIALWAVLLKIIPQVSAMFLFQPVTAFPILLAEKILQRGTALMEGTTTVKAVFFWGSRDTSTPDHRSLLAQALRNAPEIQCIDECGIDTRLPILASSCVDYYLRGMDTRFPITQYLRTIGF